MSLAALKTCSALSSQKPGGMSYSLAGNVGSSSGPTGPSQRMGRNGMYSLCRCQPRDDLCFRPRQYPLVKAEVDLPMQHDLTDTAQHV